MRRGIGVVVLLACLATARAAAPPVTGSRGFTREQVAWLTRTIEEINRHRFAGRFEEAAKLAREQTSLCERALGRDHWQTRSLRFQGESLQILVTVPRQHRAEVGRSFALNEQGVHLQAKRQDREAEKLFRDVLRIRRAALGEENPCTAESYNNVAYSLNAQGKAAEALPLYEKALGLRKTTLGEDHPDTATSYNNVATCLQALGKPARALPLYQKALRTCKAVLGEEHPDTGRSYNNVAHCLGDLGKPAEALPLYQKGLTINRNALGEDHPHVAMGYSNVGHCLQALGRHGEALPLYDKALQLDLKARGMDHPSTARSYNNVASCLQDQGKAAQAVPLFEEALRICNKALPEDHPTTAQTFNNLAVCLEALGKSVEALPLYEKALATRRKMLGDDHADTATSYNNVAHCLDALGKTGRALPLFEKALRINETVLGEDHPSTAKSYNNVAYCLQALGKPAQALPLFRKGLRICEKVLGDKHPDVAICYNNVASCLQAQGKAEKALPLFRKGLSIRKNALSEDHPLTAISSNNVASCLWLSGDRHQAARLWQSSLRDQETARFLVADSGFDRARASRGVSPNAMLAIALARLGQPRNAYRHAEASLARGLLDDLDSPFSADAAAVLELKGRLSKLSEVLVSFAGRTDLDAKEQTRLDLTRRAYQKTSGELSRLLSEQSAKQILPLSRIQEAIPVDGALVLWLDVNPLKERWGCVVRREGEPCWEPIVGTGKDGAWTDEDQQTRAKLYEALRDPASDPDERRKLLAAFSRQRLGPLRRHLKATKSLPPVERLFVVPTGPLALVPAELLDEKLSVSYVPSGSVFARLNQKRRAVDGSSLLAVGDPVFDRPAPAEPPASGVLLTQVQAEGNAHRAGLRPGDVLLSIGKVEIESSEDVPAALKRIPAAATFWREGTTAKTKLEALPLGVTFDSRSARAAVRGWRKQNVVRRGTGHKRLPGTRIEVESIAAMVNGAMTLLGSEASEQRLDELRVQGKLKSYRILHFATHGQVDESAPGRSALILAQDRLPDPLGQALQKKKVYDGRLTVSALRRWDLDADLVVLSACETGLGKDAEGDGLLGFSQAFLSRSARSVVLSRWPVDDAATSLLMRRFYQNLLGKRDGLKSPLGRAAALQEAKQWLRHLSAKEAEKAIDSLPRADLVAVPKPWGGRWTVAPMAGALSRGKLVVAPKGQAKPYEHPYYWAAFTLVGDPD